MPVIIHGVIYDGKGNLGQLELILINILCGKLILENGKQYQGLKNRTGNSKVRSSDPNLQYQEYYLHLHGLIRARLNRGIIVKRFYYNCIFVLENSQMKFSLLFNSYCNIL